MLRLLLIGCLAVHLLFFSSCKQNIAYSVLEIRPLGKDLNAKSLQQIAQLTAQDTFTIFAISDTQIAYDELRKFVKMVNSLPEDSVAFILHGGDITDYGTNMEFNYYYKQIEKIRKPVIATIGNHDMLANGRSIFSTYIGPENFSFSYGNTGFIVFNDNSREVKFDGSVPNLDFLASSTQALSHMDNLIYLSHIAPVNSDFDLSMQEPLVAIMQNADNARLSIHGHTHSYRYEDYFDNGIMHLTVPTIRKNAFVRINVEGKKITVHEETF